jgi:hypothetical protein
MDKENVVYMLNGVLFSQGPEFKPPVPQKQKKILF